MSVFPGCSNISTQKAVQFLPHPSDRITGEITDMIRRKLAAFTLLFAAGIACGCFFAERGKPAAALGLGASVMICTAVADDRKMKLRLAAFFLCGLILFPIRFASYEKAASSFSEMEIIKGRVISAEIKDSDLKMTVRSPECGNAKAIVTVSGYAEREEPETSEAYELIGSEIEANGEYSEIMPADDPGCFDYRLYMRSCGISASFRSYSFYVTGVHDSPPVRLKRYLYRSREVFLKCFDDETAAFLRGVIFGDKSGIDEDTVREFNENSTGHLLAVSGLHVGFLYGLLRILTGRRTNGRVIALMIGVIIIYGEMTMWSSATVRAAIVISSSLLSRYFNRQFDLLTSVSLAAFIILAKEPYQLFNAGFQMSFLAMCGIAFFTKPLSAIVGEALAVMLAVQAGTLPLTAYYYGMFDPLSALINVPVILLASVLVPFSIMMLMTGMMFGTVPAAAAKLIGFISYAVIKTNHVLNFEGGFTFDVAGLRGAAVAAVYMALLGASSEWVRVNLLRGERKAVMKAAALMILPVIMLGSCLYDPFADDEIVFVAVGQGDCVHIRSDGHDVLIDGGGSDSYNVGERILKPYLLREGAYKADMALVTHLHSDHFKGISELAKVYPVGAVGIPAEYRGSTETAAGLSLDGEKIIYVMPGTKIDISDDVYIEPIWPADLPDEPIAADDPNEHNTVYMVHYNGIKVMVTGDLLEEDEKEMVRYYQGTDVLDCDVLKVAHHGSKTSSSEEFLDAVSPSAAVIQVGRNNFYGHPHKQTLERLEERGIKVLRTDIDGAVGLDIRHGRIYIDLFHSEEHS